MSRCSRALLMLLAVALPGAPMAADPAPVPAQGAAWEPASDGTAQAAPSPGETTFESVVIKSEAHAMDTVVVGQSDGQADAPGAMPAPAPGVDAAVVRLTTLLDGLEHLSARFEQRITDSRGQLLRQAAGALWAARPDRFRWEIERPFAELLVGDGQVLYLWDPDLEQVTIRPYDERLKGTPARLLSGSAADLVTDFDVSSAGPDGSREVFELRPRGGEGLFDSMEIVFADEVPRILVIRDSLGQRTEVRLLDVQVGAELAADLFEFEIPQGADVLREDPSFGTLPADG